MNFDQWFDAEYGNGSGEDGLRDLLREAWNAAKAQPADVERYVSLLREAYEQLPGRGDLRRRIIQTIGEPGSTNVPGKVYIRTWDLKNWQALLERGMKSAVQQEIEEILSANSDG